MKNSSGTPREQRMSARAAIVIGEKIKKHRTDSGLSRSSLATLSGVSVSQIARLENGKGTPGMLVCLKLATALKINLSAMISEAEGYLPKETP